jgi:ribosomal protein S18 acetylase RimI-like enzyme
MQAREAKLPMSLDADVDLTIRHARLDDAPALSALMCELGYETTAVEMRRRLKSISSDARFRTFVAEMNDQVCGMIGTLTHASHEHNDPSGKIIALVVSKKTRRSGIGRALIAAAEKDFVEKRVTRVSLTTRFSREHAHRFYRALGYSRTGFRFAKQLPLVTRRCPTVASSRTDPS